MAHCTNIAYNIKLRKYLLASLEELPARFFSINDQVKVNEYIKEKIFRIFIKAEQKFEILRLQCSILAFPESSFNFIWKRRLTSHVGWVSKNIHIL